MADLSATTKIGTLMIPGYWMEFHIKKDVSLGSGCHGSFMAQRWG